MFDALMGVVRASREFDGGALVAAAAGNESQRPRYALAAGLPAAADDVISVGAVGRRTDGLLEIGEFSNRFPRLVGPGVDVVSAHVGGGLESYSGTSMACPHVAGVAALWWEAVAAEGIPPRLQAQTVESRLSAAARADVFHASVPVDGRGVGLVTAPL